MAPKDGYDGFISIGPDFSPAQLICATAKPAGVWNATRQARRGGSNAAS